MNALKIVFSNACLNYFKGIFPLASDKSLNNLHGYNCLQITKTTELIMHQNSLLLK